MLHKVVECVRTEIVHVGVEEPSSVHLGDLFHERKLASLDVQSEGIDGDIGLGAAKDFGHRLFQGLAHRRPREEGLAVVEQVGRRFAVGNDHDLTLAAFIAHEVTAEGQGVLEVGAVGVVDGERGNVFDLEFLGRLAEADHRHEVAREFRSNQ